MTKQIDFAAIEVSKRMPAVFRSEEAESFPDLAGATIVNIGAPEDSELVEGGGLVIDYVKSGKPQRLVLGFTELGMWVEYQGPRS